MKPVAVHSAASKSDLSTNDNDIFCSAASSIRDDVQHSNEGPTPTFKGISDTEDIEKSVSIVKGQLAVEEPDQFQVIFEDNDPSNPLNWSFTKRLVIVSVAILLIFNS